MNHTNIDWQYNQGILKTFLFINLFRNERVC